MEEKILNIIREFFKRQTKYYTDLRNDKVAGYIITNNQRQKLIKKIKSLNLGKC